MSNNSSIIEYHLTGFGLMAPLMGCFGLFGNGVILAVMVKHPHVLNWKCGPQVCSLALANLLGSLVFMSAGAIVMVGQYLDISMLQMSNER